MMSTPHAERPEIARRLFPLVAEALQGTPFAKPGNWRQGVAIIRKEGRRATSRGDFSQWLAANDLKDAARECLSRRIPPGSILCWLEVDVPDIATAGFVVFDIATALRKTKVAA